MKLIYLILLIPVIIFAGTKIIDYGFEDYTGNIETTPGYIFTASASSYWDDHKYSTQVVSSCGLGGAHSGTYFLHRQFNTSIVDPYLGSENGGVASSINDHGNIGGNFSYPLTGYGDNTELQFDMTTDTLIFRFWFRFSTNLFNQGLNICKFTRIYGVGGSGDAGSLIPSLMGSPGGGSASTWGMQLVSGGSWTYYYSPIHVEDGNWHCWSQRIILLNKTNTSPNLNMTCWLDDWDMEGTPLFPSNNYYRDWGNAFWYINITQNWGASYPPNLCEIDVDDIEVWDGNIIAGETPDDEIAPTADGDLSRPSDYQLRIQVYNISSDLYSGAIRFPDSSTTFKSITDNTAIDTTWTIGTGFDEWKYLYFWAVDDSGNVTHPSILLDSLYFIEPNPPSVLKTKLLNVRVRKE